MLFWHLGGTVAIARYAFRDERMDLRFLALGALLPDLIDKPIAYFVFERYNATRLWGHTLIFA
ncbi:MAG: metal-dependent hydrolase, partial [Acidimicrobiia bacterium]|nr:metal-dependent hydrolase [Acidimicrobiia bacterium]